jgi:hypothetical protein
MAEAALSMWSAIERFLRERGHAEAEVAGILRTAQLRGLDPAKIVRLLDDEKDETATLH